MNTNKLTPVGLIVLLVAGLLAAYFLTPLRELLTIDKVVEITEGVPETGLTALAFLLLFFLGGAILIPIPLMALAVSLIFPTWLSVLIVVPGFALAATGGYLVGLIFDESLFGERITKYTESVKKNIQNQAIYAIFALRIAPTPPFTVTSILSGIMRVHYLRYIAGSVLGIMPLGLSAVFFGRGALELMQDPTGMAATTLAAAIVLVSVFYIVKRKANSEIE